MQHLMHLLVKNDGRLDVLESDLDELATPDQLFRAVDDGLLTFQHDGPWGAMVEVKLTQKGRAFVGLPYRVSWIERLLTRFFGYGVPK